MTEQTWRILIVDDEEDVRNLIQQFLEEQGHEVAACPDGYAALQRLSEDEFDLVFLDFMMPDLDGISTMHKIRQLNPRLKIVMITANLADSVFDETVSDPRGADGFINKPFRLENLNTCLDVILRKGGRYISSL